MTKSLLAGNQHHMFMHADIDRGKTHSKVRPERLVGVGVVSRGGGITEPLVGSCVARKRRGKGKGKGKKGQAKRERKETGTRLARIPVDTVPINLATTQLTPGIVAAPC